MDIAFLCVYVCVNLWQATGTCYPYGNTVCIQFSLARVALLSDFSAAQFMWFMLVLSTCTQSSHRSFSEYAKPNAGICGCITCSRSRTFTATEIERWRAQGTRWKPVSSELSV